MERYAVLIQASATVKSTKLELYMVEGASPAWKKLCRVAEYLDKQAAHVMEGRTEDGVDLDLEDSWVKVNAHRVACGLEPIISPVERAAYMAVKV